MKSAPDATLCNIHHQIGALTATASRPFPPPVISPRSIHRYPGKLISRELTWIEAAFKSMKSDLAIRPIYHYVPPRVEAHILVAFMGYCLMTTLRKHLEPRAPGLSPKAVLEQLASIQMLEVCLPTSDGRWLIMPRHTEPEPEQKMLLEKLNLELPPQPPPRIRRGKLLMPEPRSDRAK